MDFRKQQYTPNALTYTSKAFTTTLNKAVSWSYSTLALTAFVLRIQGHGKSKIVYLYCTSKTSRVRLPCIGGLLFLFYPRLTAFVFAYMAMENPKSAANSNKRLYLPLSPSSSPLRTRLVQHSYTMRANFVLAVPAPIDQLLGSLWLHSTSVHAPASCLDSERHCFKPNLSFERNAAEHTVED